jgi:hypothetical protein
MYSFEFSTALDIVMRDFSIAISVATPEVAAGFVDGSPPEPLPVSSVCSTCMSNPERYTGSVKVTYAIPAMRQSTVEPTIHQRPL